MPCGSHNAEAAYGIPAAFVCPSSILILAFLSLIFAQVRYLVVVKNILILVKEISLLSPQNAPEGLEWHIEIQNFLGEAP